MSDTEYDVALASKFDSSVILSEKKPKNKLSVEKIYKKMTQHEHILSRPDTYIGSIETTEQEMWCWNSEENKMQLKTVNYVPGLYKIFDEILVNAADNKQRDVKNCTTIKIDIDVENNRIKVWNNGRGIEVIEHKKEGMWVPEMIFGHLLTSSNYDDTQDKVTGGRNGYGAKLCNIFSKRFVLETSSNEYKKKFKMEWKGNMLKKGKPKITPFSGSDSTSITFEPDLEKFNMTHLDKDIISVLTRRAYDCAATTGCKIFLNGQKLPVSNFKTYCELFIKDAIDNAGNPIKLVHEKINDHWEIGVALSDSGYKHMSFCNSIATVKGGKHLDYVSGQVTRKIKEKVAAKVKNTKITDFYIKNHMWVFCNALIVNPTFDSQTKETMTLASSKFKTKCELNDSFMKKVLKAGIVEAVASFAEFKNQKKLESKGGHKTSKLKGVPKLEDANDAGTKNGEACTLILTEGDSAKSTAVCGLGVIGRDKYGVFPLRGKLLNVREAPSSQISNNAEIQNICKIIGLNYKEKYADRMDMKKLRYGKVMIMTDQDHDGSHIKGLVINFIHSKWPKLLQQNFLEEFITPIVKVTRGNNSLSFYSMPEYEQWQNECPTADKWSVKYYKGLGTSSAKESKEYFNDMKRHRIPFRYGGDECDKSIELAFAKKCVDDRKTWLTNYMNVKKELVENGEPEDYLYKPDTKYLTYKDFVDKELILFSHADLERSVPNMVDGLKPGQRKILYTFFTKYKNIKKEIKVAQASGGVSEHSAYHHGEVSLQQTIVNMAQNFVGSNNLNLLQPNGQFGTRLLGGKDSASARYIFTQMSPLARLLFPAIDDNVLNQKQDDGQFVEPEWYCPILPLVLLNGSDGIGTGWSTKIPNHDIRQVLENVRLMISGEEPRDLDPSYKNFTGHIQKFDENRYGIYGEIAQLDDTTCEITELPIKTWTSNYKENVLDILISGKETKGDAAKKDVGLIKDYKDYSTESRVRFVVTFPSAAKMREAEISGIHKFFKCSTSMTHENTLTLFDNNGCLQRYKKTTDIMKDFFQVRLQKYIDRKEYLINLLTAESDTLSNKVRFIKEICEKKISITNKKKLVLIQMLKDRKYDKDPMRTWKLSKMTVEEKRVLEERENEKEDAENSDSDTKSYNYLLSMPLWSLSLEKKEALEKQQAEKLKELEKTKATTKEQFWLADLDKFEESLDKIEKAEREELENEISTASKSMSKFKSSSKSKVKKEIKVKREVLPSKDGIRFEPKIEIPDKPKARKTSGEKRTKKEKVKKEAEDKSAKGTKKLVDYGFTAKAKVEMEDVKPISKNEISSMLKKKPGKSAMKTGSVASSQSSQRRPDTDDSSKPPKKRKKMEWETDSDKSDEASEIIEFNSDSSEDVKFSKVKLPSRKFGSKVVKEAPKVSEKKTAKKTTKKSVFTDSDSDSKPVGKISSPKRPKPSSKKPSKPSRKVVVQSSESETIDDTVTIEDSESESEDEMTIDSPPKASRVSARSRNKKPIKYVSESEKEESEEESVTEEESDDSFEMVN